MADEDKRIQQTTLIVFAFAAAIIAGTLYTISRRAS